MSPQITIIVRAHISSRSGSAADHLLQQRGSDGDGDVLKKKVDLRAESLPLSQGRVGSKTADPEASRLGVSRCPGA